MGQEVNPPPQILLPKALVDMGIEVIDYFQQQARFDLQIWNRTGAGQDFIDDADQSITSSSSRVSRNSAKIDALEFIRFRVVEVTEDYTAAPFEIVICSNIIPITVTLETNAIFDDQIHVKRKPNAAKVTTLGAIDGETSRVINIKNWSDFYVFGSTEWAVI